MIATKYRLELPNILFEESSFDYKEGDDKLNSPYIIRDVMNDVFRMNKQAEEYLYMIAVDAKCKPIGFFEVSHGSVSNSIANPREIFIRALLCGAVQIILVHNHPSGDPTPGKDDFEVTEKIKSAGEIIGVPLVDHIILGKGNIFYSFKEAEFL